MGCEQCYNMNHMFRSATLFNQDIGDWGTSNVTHTGKLCSWVHLHSTAHRRMGCFFSGQTEQYEMDVSRSEEAFNQDIITGTPPMWFNMNTMFWAAHSFNQAIGSWDGLSKVMTNGELVMFPSQNHVYCSHV